MAGPNTIESSALKISSLPADQQLAINTLRPRSPISWKRFQFLFDEGIKPCNLAPGSDRCNALRLSRDKNAHMFFPDQYSRLGQDEIAQVCLYQCPCLAHAIVTLSYVNIDAQVLQVDQEEFANVLKARKLGHKLGHLLAATLRLRSDQKTGDGENTVATGIAQAAALAFLGLAHNDAGFLNGQITREEYELYLNTANKITALIRNGVQALD